MPTEEELLASIVASAREAHALAMAHSPKDLDSNRMLELSLTKLVENIGEAARLLSDETRLLAPDIPWRDIVAMRHRLVHDYSSINLEILWEVVAVDCPKLVAAVAPLISVEEED